MRECFEIAGLNGKAFLICDFRFLIGKQGLQGIHSKEGNHETHETYEIERCKSKLKLNYAKENRELCLLTQALICYNRKAFEIYGLYVGSADGDA